MTEPQFVVASGDDACAPLVTARGEIDLSNVDQFRVVLDEAASAAETVEVDLREVTYCDSAAMRALFTVAAHTKLTVSIRDRGPVTALLRISGLDRITTVRRVD